MRRLYMRDKELVTEVLHQIEEAAAKIVMGDYLN